MVGFDPTDELAWLALADWLEEEGYCGDVVRHHPINMAYIPAGTFLMGSPDNEEGRDGDEGPQHRVTLTKGFSLGIYPVTQAQWQAVMGSNPSNFTGDNHPVENVSWDDCKAFCEKLRQVTGKPFRLPTEAEWEYACRAGTPTVYHSGNDEEALKKVGWFNGNSNGQTQPVGQKTPNAWGLYDMHGNVYEWCQDWYDKDYYANSPLRDPAGSSEGSARAIRGGCWYFLGMYCRSAIRYCHSPESRYVVVGFRVAISE